MSHAGTQDRIVSGKEPPRFQNPYPYPAHAKPTPHQIFHLGPGATQGEIKERYYDLVRAHHPDSSYARLSTNNSAEAHSRFRSIKAAYDFLRGRTLSPDPNANPTPSPQNFDPYMHELARRRRAYNASRDSFGRTAWAEGFGAPQQERGEWNENGKKERLILLFGVAALVGGLFPSLPMTFISIIFPTSVLSMFPFSLFASSSLAPLSLSSNTPFDSPPSVPSSSFIFSFLLEFDKTRAAATALSEARQEARDMGVERREGVRKRVKEMAKETGKEEESTTREQR
ncbi:hypothetical protein BYT27DRAFT_7217897 [Phlegmacium glaucopus]|nr:hypothetical protein BYT27DRAFT_7217897 [Phlegmacium glaucopus]